MFDQLSICGWIISLGTDAFKSHGVRVQNVTGDNIEFVKRLILEVVSIREICIANRDQAELTLIHNDLHYRKIRYSEMVAKIRFPQRIFWAVDDLLTIIPWKCLFYFET